MANIPGQQLQEDMLASIRNGQELVIDAIRKWVETIQSMTPNMPSFGVPGADQLPKPEQLVANAYDFAEQLLASQRKFAEEVVRATSALQPGDGTGPQPGGGTGPQPGGGTGPQPPA